MRAWSQEASQALMFLANYSKKKGDFAEAEQYCATFRNLSHFVLVLADHSCSHAVFMVACFASSPFLRKRTSGKDLLDRGGGGHKEQAKALLRDMHSHHAHENSLSSMMK